MPFVFKGTTVKKLNYRGTACKKHIAKGVQVWSAEVKVASAFGSGTAQNWTTREKSATSSTFTCAVGDVIKFTCLQHLQADNAGFNAENNISIGGGYRIYKGSTVVNTNGRDVHFNGTQNHKDQTWNVSYTVTSAGTYKVEVFAFVGPKDDKTIYASAYTNITSDIIVS